MSDPDEFELKLKVWARIQDGTASPEDHSLAVSWGEQSRADYFATASLHDQWMMQHGEGILKCWPFPANQHTNSDYPLEQILLFAVMYGKSEIENGCLDQFFGNHTGDFAPETADGLELLGARAASKIIRQAMLLFGDSFPRERMTRQEMLPALALELSSLSDAFFVALPSEKEFGNACDELLKRSLT